MKTRNKIKSFAIGLFLGISGLALASTFNLFSPATGVLKGSASTYVTTAAASSDIRAMWSGTCNASSFLRGDGACAAAGTGSVTSVGLTMPTGFSVGGSPVTISGTLAVTTTLNGPLRGNGSGLVTGSLALGSEVSGTLPVGNGGIGVGTLTGIAKGNGTSAFTAAASSDVISLWSGTCNSSSYLRGDGSCNTPGGGGTVTSVGSGTGITASPNPIVGAGTLAVDQTSAFAPSWLGVHTYARVSSGSDDPSLIIASARAVMGITDTDIPNDRVAIQNSSGDFRIDANNAAGTVLNNAFTMTQTAGVVDTLTFGNGTNNPTFGFLGTGAATFGGDIISNGVTPQLTANGTDSYLKLNRTTQAGGEVGVSFNAAGTASWFLFQSANDTAIKFYSATSGTVLSITQAGAASITGSLAVNGSAVCQADGTNCPAASGTIMRVKTASTARNTTTTKTCDPDLTITSGMAANKWFSVEAFLPFQFGGSSTNGYQQTFTLGGTGPPVMRNGMWAETNNTATPNVATVGNTPDSVGGTFTFVQPGSSISIYGMTFHGTMQGGTATNGTICVSWAQAASSGTDTTLREGAWLKVTQLN